jgi:hypothetical protein
VADNYFSIVGSAFARGRVVGQAGKGFSDDADGGNADFFELKLVNYQP